MSTLVLQSHPLEDSYNVALLDKVVELAPQARVLRLAQGDRLTPYACIGVSRLIAVYPTWWGSLPAHMLAAVQELLSPWVDGYEQAATSPLRSVTSLTVVTSHGSSKLINVLQGEPGLHLWKRTVLPLCAPGATFSWQSLYKIDRASLRDRTNFLNTLTLDDADAQDAP